MFKIILEIIKDIEKYKPLRYIHLSFRFLMYIIIVIVYINMLLIKKIIYIIFYIYQYYTI